jgi:hypothetical protein
MTRTQLTVPCSKCGAKVKLGTRRSPFQPAGPRLCLPCVARLYGGFRLRMDLPNHQAGVIGGRHE